MGSASAGACVGEGRIYLRAAGDPGDRGRRRRRPGPSRVSRRMLRFRLRYAAKETSDRSPGSSPAAAADNH